MPPTPWRLLLPSTWPFQGVTYWQNADDRGLSETNSDGPFRVLLRFNGLHTLVSPAANITQARLNLTFLNWGDSATLQASREAGGRRLSASGIK